MQQVKSLGLGLSLVKHQLKLRLVMTSKLQQRAHEAKLTPPTQDGSFSMEIQYKVKHMSQQLGGNIELAIQVINNPDPFL